MYIYIYIYIYTYIQSNWHEILTMHTMGSSSLSPGTSIQVISMASGSPGEHGVRRSSTVTELLLRDGPRTWGAEHKNKRSARRSRVMWCCFRGAIMLFYKVLMLFWGVHKNMRSCGLKTKFISNNLHITIPLYPAGHKRLD